MNKDDAALNGMVDLIFPLRGRNLPADYPQLLRDALTDELPWLSDEPAAGVHPIKLAHGSGDQFLLSGRSRLVLRVPLVRLEAARGLAGRTLRLAGREIVLGEPHVRELFPHAALYAYAVAARNSEETDFVDMVSGALSELGIRAPWICGRRGACQTRAGSTTTFSLMVHNLSNTDSLRLQELGLGELRLLGCGIFVPHKTTAAVGD